MSAVCQSHLFEPGDDEFKLCTGGEPGSPAIDREQSISRQIELANEKKAILQRKLELKTMEERLSEINAENAKLEAELASIQDGGGGDAATTKKPGTLNGSAISGCSRGSSSTILFGRIPGYAWRRLYKGSHDPPGRSGVCRLGFTGSGTRWH